MNYDQELSDPAEDYFNYQIDKLALSFQAINFNSMWYACCI